MNHAQSRHGGRVRELARELQCEPENILDFSASMNPHAPEISEALWQAMRPGARYYPPDDVTPLAARLAMLYQADPANIVPTAGAMEALRLACSLFRGRRIHLLEPTFSEYARLAKAEDLHPVTHRTQLDDIGSAFDKLCENLEENDLVLLCQPNNPTGQLIHPQHIRERVQASAAHGVYWIFDEAFIEFTASNDASMLPHLHVINNALVCRSLTKSWHIPGLRLGFLACADKPTLGSIHQHVMPWSLSGPAVDWAMHCLEADAYARNSEYIRELLAYADVFADALDTLPDWEVYPSDSSYFLCRTPDKVNALRLAEHLKEERMLVRTFPQHPGLDPERHLRISARVPDENRKLLQFLRHYQPDNVSGRE